MGGELIKAMVALIVSIFVMFLVYYGMGFMVDTFLFVTSGLAMTNIGLRLSPINMKMFNWFYMLGGFLALVSFIWVIKVIFFKNKYEEGDFGGRQF